MKSLRQAGLFAFSLLSLLFVIPHFALAVGNLHLGPLKVHPFLEVSESYDDNIYLAPSQEEEDFVTVVSPGVRLELPFLGRHSFQAGYRADLYAYTDNDMENRQDQKADALLHLDFPVGLEVKLGDVYTHGAEPRTHEFPGGKRFYDDNRAYAQIGYRFLDVWKTELSYENIYHRYADQPWHHESSHQDNGFGATLFFRFLPKTSFLVEYHVVDTNYAYLSHDIRDNRAHTVYGGLYWDPTAKLSGALKGGYTWKRFRKREVAEENNANTWSIASDLLWRATDRTQLKLTAEREYRDYLLEPNLYYRITTGTLTFNQKILTKLTFIAHGYVERDEFGRKTFNPDRDRDMRRRDTLWGAGAGLLYQIQEWLSAELDYTYRDRNSNFNFYDYKDNLVILTVKFML